MRMATPLFGGTFYDLMWPSSFVGGLRFQLPTTWPRTHQTLGARCLEGGGQQHIPAHGMGWD